MTSVRLGHQRWSEAHPLREAFCNASQLLLAAAERDGALGSGPMADAVRSAHCYTATGAPPRHPAASEVRIYKEVEDWIWIMPSIAVHEPRRPF